jgi:hypothetical protein
MTEDLDGKNYIRTKISEDRKTVSLQMFIRNEPGQWIKYDAEQLDGLIKLLDQARETIGGKGDNQ